MLLDALRDAGHGGARGLSADLDGTRARTLKGREGSANVHTQLTSGDQHLIIFRSINLWFGEKEEQSESLATG